MRLTNEELLEKLTRVLAEDGSPETLTELLEEVQPSDLAEILGELEEEQASRTLLLLSPDFAAGVLEYLEYITQYRLLHHMEPAAAQQILSQVSSDAVADLVQAVHPRQAQRLMNLLPSEYAASIRRLLEYPENSAGGRMTIDYVSVRQYMTAEQVLAHIRKVGREAETVAYIYVVDPAGRLSGVLSLRDLIMAAPRERVSEFMNTQVVSVPATMDQEEVARVVSKYDFVAIPVVSPENRLLGIITVDDVIDVIHEEAGEDVLQMGGTSAPDPDEVESMALLQQVWALAKPRLPWLVGLLFMEIGASLVVKGFDGKFPAALFGMLALFQVVMTGESGNAATQALAVVVRGLATGEIEFRDLPRVVFREALVGLVVGTVAGGTLTIVAGLWLGNFTIGFAVGLALAANLLLAKCMGVLFPIVITRLGIDPAVASGPFITTVTDNTALFIYYGIAALILRTVA